MDQVSTSGSMRLIDRAMQPFPILVLFFLILFLTGGSSWSYEGQLIVLRPAAVLVAFWGLANARLRDFRQNLLIWLIFMAIVLLTTSHLMPLPYSWWTSLPGRQIIAEIDAAAGLGEISRPLSMMPEATLNALLSLIVPLAVLVLAMKLDERSHRRIAGMVLIAATLSGFMVILQISGANLSFYNTGPSVGSSGLFNNRNHQAVFLTMVFPLAALAWSGGYQSGLDAKVERGIALGASFFAFLLILAVGSRSGLILMCLGLVLLFANAACVAWGSGKFWTIVARGSASVIIVGALVLLSIWAGRDEAILRLFGAGPELRFPLWNSIIEILPTYLPWGSGIGSYAEVYQIQEPDMLLRPTFSNHAHNEILEIALTAGIPGLAILLAAVLAFVTGAIRVWRLDKSATALSQAGFMLILLLALASIADYPIRTPIMSGILALATIWFSARFSNGGEARTAQS